MSAAAGRIPNFRGQRALVLHRQDRNGEAILGQLERLGLFVALRWPAEAVSADGIDVVFFDADNGFDGLFAWECGEASVPLIAVLGSEAPGRLEWTLAQRCSAYLMKPIGSTGVFSALTIAFNTFAEERARAAVLQRLDERLRLREAVIAAAADLMRRHDVGADAALRLLRQESMRRRSSIEAVAALVLDGKWLPGDGARRSSVPPVHDAKRKSTA
jgi:AmiR/NasT family two-component response regulator